jgi:hypothetical protein
MTRTNVSTDVVQKEEFSITCAKCTLDERPSIFKRDKPIF